MRSALIAALCIAPFLAAIVHGIRRENTTRELHMRIREARARDRQDRIRNWN